MSSKCSIDIQEFTPFQSYLVLFIYSGRQWQRQWFSTSPWTEQKKHARQHFSALLTKHIFLPQKFSPVQILASQYGGGQGIIQLKRKQTLEERRETFLLIHSSDSLWQTSPSLKLSFVCQRQSTFCMVVVFYSS